MTRSSTSVSPSSKARSALPRAPLFLIAFFSLLAACVFPGGGLAQAAGGQEELSHPLLGPGDSRLQFEASWFFREAEGDGSMILELRLWPAGRRSGLLPQSGGWRGAGEAPFELAAAPQGSRIRFERMSETYSYAAFEVAIPLSRTGLMGYLEEGGKLGLAWR